MTVAYSARRPRAATTGPDMHAHPAPRREKGTAPGMKLSLPNSLGGRLLVQGVQCNFSPCPTRPFHPTAQCNSSRSPKTRLRIFSLPAQPWRTPPRQRREHPSSTDVHSLLTALTENPTGCPSNATFFSAWDAWVAANSSCSLARGKEKQPVR